MFLENEVVLFDFNLGASISKWRQTNDAVMGGISKSKMIIDKNGNGVFKGNVSLENNGGFAMSRLPLDVTLTKSHKKMVLSLKGDGKVYQVRIKSITSQKYWYIASFETGTEAQQIEIPLKDFYPSYRGRILKLDNFAANTIQEIAFLIGNKKKETFKLTIDKITIE